MKSKITLFLLALMMVNSLDFYAKTIKINPNKSTLSNGTVQCNTEIPVPLVSGTFDNLSATSSTSGVCLVGCGISNINRLTDSNLTNSATANTLIGVGVTHRLRVTDSNDIFASGTFAGFRIAPNGGLLSVDLLNNISIKTYLAGNLRETTTGISLINLSLLSDPGNYILGFNTSLTFDAIEISISSLAGVSTSTSVYYAVIRNYCAGPELTCNTPTALNLPNYPAAIETNHTGLSGVDVGSIDNAENAVSSSISDYAGLNLLVGVVGSASLSVKDEITDYPIGTYAGFDVENVNLLTASAISNVVIRTYLNGTFKEQFSGTNLLVNGTLLSATGRNKLGFVSTTAFDEVQISINQVAGASLGLTKVYSAVFERFCAGPALPCNTQTAINAPTYPVYIDGERTGTDGIACALCSITGTDNLIDANTTNYANIDLTASVGTASKIAVKDQITDYPAGTFAGFDIESIGLLNVNAFDAITVTTYLNGVQRESKTGNGPLISVNTILIVGSGRQTVGFVSTLSFDEVRIRLANLATVTLGTVKVYSAVLEKFCPTTVACNQTYALTNPTFPVTIDGDKSGISGVACAACAVTNPGNVLTADTSDYARITITAGVAAAGSLAVADQLFTYPAGTIAGFTIKDLNNLIELDLFQSLTISTYNNGVLQELKTGGQLLSLTLLAPIFGSGPGYYNVGFKATLPFDEIKIRVGSLASVISNVNVYGAFVNTKDSNDGGTGSLNCNVSDLSIIKTPSITTPSVGSSITFTIVATNGGPRDADGVVVNDILPSGYTYVSSTVSTGAYNNVTGVWTIGNLNAGANATLTVTALVKATGNYANTATITGNQPDPNPGNNTSTSTPTPVNVIVANDDTGNSINGYTGGTAFTNVLVNDTINGQPIVSSQVSTTFVSSTNAGITLSGTNVNVAAGTPAGSYSLTYRICEVSSPANCDTAVVTVTVTAAPIDAVNDAGSANGASGGTAVANVLVNDTLNGSPVVASQVNTSFVSSSNAGITLSGTAVNVAPGTPAGTYTLTYQICEKLNPTNCDSAIVTVTVTAAPIDAVNDSGSANGASGGTAVANVLTNDTLNGAPVNINQVNLTTVSSNPNLTLNANGSVSVAPGTPAGTYTLTYQICEKLNPTNCDSAIVTVTVTAAPIDAVNDSGSANGTSGGTAVANVLVNDTLNGSPVVASQVNTSFVSSSNSGITLSGTAVNVASGTPAGTYTLTYQICEKLNPTNCDSAIVTVTVACEQIQTPTLGTVTQPTCTTATGSFTITNYNAAYTYTVTPSNGVTISGSTITAPAGSYTVKATLGICSSAASASVTVNAQPATPAQPTLGPVTQPTCTTATGSFTITNYNAAYTYAVTPSNGVTISGGTITAPAGTYTVKATLGACTSIASASVTVNAQPATPDQPTLGIVTQPSCTTATGSFTITNYNAAYTYAVTPSNGITISGNTITAPAGTYTVKATLGTCTSIASASVTVNAQPATPAQPTLGPVTQPTCMTATGSFTITNYNASYTYAVTPSNGVTISGSTVTAPAGTYTVKATLGACTSIASASVTVNAQPTTCSGAGIFHTTVTCTDYRNNPGSQLVGQLCYTTRSGKVANVTPGQFFYFTSITAPSASFCIDIVETKACSSLALFAIQQSNQVTLYNASCSNVAAGTQVSLGLGRVCISNATPGAQYVLSVKYDSKSVLGSAYTGSAPTCLYSFESRIDGVTVAGSSTSINLSPNCTAKSDVTEPALIATIAPNPSLDTFGLQVKSESDEPINIRIIDMNGRIIKQFSSIQHENIEFGSELARGLYLIEVSQGIERKVLKAQKL